jgi:hypothetical protein
VSDEPILDWSRGVIYYIMSSETGRMKIGYTKGKPEKRLRALQTGSPTKLSIVAIHPGTPNTERDLHNKFKEERAHGEWFDISDELIVHCAEVYSLLIAIAKAEGREPPAWAVTGLDAIIANFAGDEPANDAGDTQ